MKTIQDKIIESKDKLPKLRQLKKIPEWCSSYPDFCDKIKEIWNVMGRYDKLFVATMVYFMTGDEEAIDYRWPMIKEKIKNLYHK